VEWGGGQLKDARETPEIWSGKKKAKKWEARASGGRRNREREKTSRGGEVQGPSRQLADMVGVARDLGGLERSLRAERTKTKNACGGAKWTGGWGKENRNERGGKWESGQEKKNETESDGDHCR